MIKVKPLEWTRRSDDVLIARGFYRTYYVDGYSGRLVSEDYNARYPNPGEDIKSVQDGKNKSNKDNRELFDSAIRPMIEED